MNVVIAPALDGLACERLRAFAAQLADPASNEAAICELTVTEATWARRTPLLNGQTRAYEAAIRLLADLRLLKWTVRADACGIELESPPGPRRCGATPEEIRAAKDEVRRELAPALAAQFADPLVRTFILDLEEPLRGSRRKSIRNLVADGAEVFVRHQPSLEAAPADRATTLARVIQPYLQLVPGEGEPTMLDEFTGIPLGDVWRYFRYTWSIPQTAIPGRQMFYLIRDRAHPAHAVIGIAALGNSPLVSPPRDKKIGWHPNAFAERLRAASQAENRDELFRLFQHLKSLVVDLSLRNPLSQGFAGKLLGTLLHQSDIVATAKAGPESDLAWNLRHLLHSTIHARLLELFARLAAAGHRATVRELWVWAARLLFGSGQEDRKPVRSPERWYSSRLFELDDRFTLSSLLRDLADPAAHSHPRWDYRLETGQVPENWLVDGAPSLVRMDEGNFRALKRRFYFEHQSGEDVFKLDGRPGADLLNILRAANPPEDAFKRLIIESINLAYCPVLFSEMKTLLFLWIGHRFHEQPSHGHVANQSLSDHELKLLRPRLLSRLQGAFDYQPDHLLLEYRRPGTGVVRLRVDHPLFVALERLRQGLPRQLLPDRELNRLDYFLEQLRRSDVSTSREFYIHNHAKRTTAKVVLSADFSSYESVQTP